MQFVIEKPTAAAIRINTPTIRYKKSIRQITKLKELQEWWVLTRKLSG